MKPDTRAWAGGRGRGRCAPARSIESARPDTVAQSRRRREALPEMGSSASRLEVRLALYRSWAGWPVRVPYGGYQVPEHAESLRVVSPRFIRQRRAGLEVQVWTIDAAADMERLLGWGADALIANRPDLAVTIRTVRVLRTIRSAGRP